MRSAVSQASNAYNNASNTSSRLGAEASGIGANVTPYLTQQMLHPQGYSQQDTSSMLAAGMGAAGGANSSLVGQANQQAAVSRNSGGFQSALDDAARQRSKAEASTAEGIASNNANLKQTQQQEAAKGLEGMYNTDTSGMLEASGQEANDVNAETNASKTGWLQNAEGLVDTASNAANAAANVKKAW